MRINKILSELFLTLFFISCFCGDVRAAHVLTPHEQLGKSIFFDKNLSIRNNQSCASCHDPAAGWTGPDSNINAHGAVYHGSIEVRFGDRKPPSSAYAAVSPVFYFEKREGHFIGGNFWDGRATGDKLRNAAADQALGPFLNPVEQALPDASCVVYRVCSANYAISLERVNPGECNISWPSDIESQCAQEKKIILSDKKRKKVEQAFNAVALAVAAYEASAEVNLYTSKFDYYLKGIAKLTEEETKGLELFNEKGKCSKCHISEGAKPLLTDFTYDNLGVPKNPEHAVYKENPDFIDRGLGGFLENAETPVEWQKRAKENMGKHKVPTLRNVDKRPNRDFVKAYMHNGYFKTLKGVVHFYNTRDVKTVCTGTYTESKAMAENCWPRPEVKDNVNSEELGDLKLTEEEEDAIVAFMKTLSDGFVPDKKK